MQVPFRHQKRLGAGILATAALALGFSACSGTWSSAKTSAAPGLRFEQRNEVSYLRGPYNFDFYRRHNEAYRFSAAIHFAHAKAHDVPQLTPLEKASFFDRQLDAEMLHFIHSQPRIEPHMEYWGPHTGLFAWDLYRAIDWTHIHHEQTYDILASKEIPWPEKAEWTKRSVDYYLKWIDIPRSTAPLDVTMRRAATMMKPYFAYFRTYYPKSAEFFYIAHWWHPAIYEAQMIGGNDEEQHQAVQSTHQLTYREVVEDRPKRMLLSREMMPRYSRLSPESANIFDNLHMLHGIAYSILSYPHYSEEEKRKELYRVIEAMKEQPGDRELARKFSIPKPNMDPRVYEDWMKGVRSPGLGMNEIMAEMLREMWPKMSRDGSAEPPPAVWEQFWLKVEPGMQPGEKPGSLHDAIMAVYPEMKMNKEAMKPGKTPNKMVKTMLAGWRKKHGNMPPAPAISMEQEPKLLPIPASAEFRRARRQDHAHP